MNNQTTNQQKNILTIPIAIIITGLIVAGAIIYTNFSQSSEGTAKKPQGTAQILPSDGTEEDVLRGKGLAVEFSIDEGVHVRGNFEAPVTIVEFSDFQCPFCQRFHPTLQQILADYPNQVRWVYKHFPLDSIHPQARPAAEASECVFEQAGDDGFWQFTDGLLENQPRLGKSLYQELASEIGVNLSQFDNCISSGKYKDKVEADYQEGIKAGIQGTPGSFVNGEEIPGAVPYDYLKDAVERALTNLE